MKEKKEDTVQNQPIVVANAQQPEKKVVCDVCGYVNPEYTSMCKMCSNYLGGKND